MLVGRTIRSEVHKLINSNLNKENCLNSGRSQLLYLFIRRATKMIVVITEVRHFCCVEVGVGVGSMDWIDLAQSGDRWQLL
jgi:hypothetical protein